MCPFSFVYRRSCRSQGAAGRGLSAPPPKADGAAESYSSGVLSPTLNAVSFTRSSCVIFSPACKSSKSCGHEAQEMWRDGGGGGKMERVGGGDGIEMLGWEWEESSEHCVPVSTAECQQGRWSKNSKQVQSPSRYSSTVCAGCWLLKQQLCTSFVPTHECRDTPCGVRTERHLQRYPRTTDHTALLHRLNDIVRHTN